MQKLQAITIHRTYTNNGQHLQQVVDFTVTGLIRKADNKPWNMESDIPEYMMSVKSARATIASDLIGETLLDKVNDYFTRVASVNWAYITKDGWIYIMNMREFREFVMTFATLQRDSTKNGGRMKVRLPHETKKVIEWLSQRA
jgi:hypothetical protein